MGSLGSVSFLIQASSTISCSSVHERRTVFCYKRPHFVPVFGISSLDSNGVVRKTRSFGVVKCKNSDGEKEEVGRSDNEESVDDDTHRATIRQSKEVLARQKELLRKIEERRKLVSSIKLSSVNTEMDAVSFIESVNTEMDAVSFNESDSYFLNRNRSSTSGKLDEKYGANAASEESEQPSQVDIPSVDGKSSYENVIENRSPAEHFLADALGLFSEASSETARIEIRSPSSSTVSKHKLTKEESLVDMKEANAEDSNSNQDAAIEEGIKDSPPLAGANVMNVILVAAECAPWSKTGGLGDVAGALPKALARRGHRVMVVVPRYGNYSEPQDLGVRKRYKIDGQDMEVSYFHAYIDGVDYVFIDSPIFWHRGNAIYGGNHVDILKRMILFCKAAVEVPWNVPCSGVCYGDGNLVFIANDWHTALLPVYMKAYYRDHGLMKYTRCVLVIHNIAYQGRGPVEDFSFVDLPAHYIDLFKFYDPVGGEHFNIFAAGLKTADRVVTVSHGYAWELKTLEGGWGLHGIINQNDWKFQGIVNGVDTNDWNPKLDVHLKSDGYTNYSLETLQTGKPQCKSALQRELGFSVRDNVPIIGFIGRLDHQKGVDIIAEAMHWIVGQDVQLIMLGTGRQDLEEMIKKIQSQHSDKVRGWVGFSEKMAHRITAGADILLMPSRFEPCGLNQLYAMMYGTAPVVHAIGGLKDTVQPFDPYNETGYGWTFERAEVNSLIDALGNCLKTYFNYKTSWEGLQSRGMMQDLSWDNAAQKYEDVLVAAKYQW